MDEYTKLGIVLIITIGVVWLVGRKYRFKWQKPTSTFPGSWRKILISEVDFYKKLNTRKKRLFEYKVHEFLENCHIEGYDTTVEDLDRILVASSAIIPIFSFPEWKYRDLEEVLLYPSNFNLDFETEGRDRSVLGMVGEGIMDRKMILSREALRQGFKNERDKRNTAIHEFMHLIDRADGSMDGIPSVLLEKQYVLPWVKLIEQKLKLLREKRLDIRPYGGESTIELFAVLGEYFFERPELLRKHHPVLYEMLERIFKGSGNP